MGQVRLRDTPLAKLWTTLVDIFWLQGLWLRYTDDSQQVVRTQCTCHLLE